MYDVSLRCVALRSNQVSRGQRPSTKGMPLIFGSNGVITSVVSGTETGTGTGIRTIGASRCQPRPCSRAL